MYGAKKRCKVRLFIPLHKIYPNESDFFTEKAYLYIKAFTDYKSLGVNP